MSNENILIVIPARGGSKGIPRKNVRKLGKYPLIFYSIKTALSSKFKPDVYVSSDDEEILSLSKIFGAKIHKRSKSLSQDEVTLDPVIYEAYMYAQKKEKKEYDLIITMQPTSPLLKTETLDNAIEKMIKNPLTDTLISAKESTHLTWKKINNKYIPNYKKRVNRQFLTPSFIETGGFLITRKNVIKRNSRIGRNVDLYILKSPENIDIDTYEDWQLCEYYLNRKKILFVVSGNEKIGLGHVYNTLAIANDIVNHDISFLVTKDSKLAFDKILLTNYPVYIQSSDNIINDIVNLGPDIVINDILDTSKEYILSLKNKGLKVINFEDLGEGARFADLVINAIYPEKEILPNHYFGHKYVILREEFIHSPFKKIEYRVKDVLITFGGVDPNNYTQKVLDSIYEYCLKQGIQINVITGFGYKNFSSLEKYKGINIYKNVKNISEFILKADVVFSSAGRTIYEIASIGTPTIVMAQNERELTHFYASPEYGFLNLGLGKVLSTNDILEEFKKLVENYELRKHMNKLMLSEDIRGGKERVLKLIKELIEEDSNENFGNI